MQLFCGRYVVTSGGLKTLSDDQIQLILQGWRKYETTVTWQLVDCKQNVQAYSDIGVNLSQTAVMENILQQELKRQRVKPEQVVKHDYLPYILLAVAGACHWQSYDLGLRRDQRVAVLCLLVAYLFNSLHLYTYANRAYQAQFLRYKKLESELRPLPRSFHLKLMTNIVATPDEIAEALTDPIKRKQWDLNIDQVTQTTTNELDITYLTSQSRYLFKHTLLNHNQTYLCHEHIKVNGGQTSAQRLY